MVVGIVEVGGEGMMWGLEGGFGILVCPGGVLIFLRSPDSAVGAVMRRWPPEPGAGGCATLPLSAIFRECCISRCTDHRVYGIVDGFRSRGLDRSASCLEMSRIAVFHVL